jgi:hypothetical protein
VTGYREKRPTAQLKVAVSLAAIVVLSGLTITNTIGVAQAVLVPLDEHWKYHIDWWSWDSERRKSVGHIIPVIVIQNQTENRLEGYMADANGTRLAPYQGEQVIQARFSLDNGMRSDWDVVDRIHDGYFTIEIPESYKEASKVSIFVGSHEYTVDNGTPTTPQTWVLINSARIDYLMNSTLAQPTQVAQEDEQNTITEVYHSGSLIDYILNQYRLLLSIRGSNSGE